MKTRMLLATTLTLALISSFSALAASRTAVAAPAVTVQTQEVKTLTLEQITSEVSPEMRLMLEEIKVQALAQAQLEAQAQVNAGDKASVQDFYFTARNARSSASHIKDAKLDGFAVRALGSGGYEVHNPSSGEKVKITITVTRDPLTITITISW